MTRVRQASLLLIVISGFYIFAMMPSVSVGDSGEFIAASTTLGLPHAPSYPLFVLAGKCATLLFPFASDAYRVNLAGAFFGAGTAALVFLLGLRLGLSAWSSGIGALALAFSNLLWEPALAAEVFTLNGLMLAACLYALSMDEECAPLPARVYLCAFLLGVGLGNHHTLVLALPAFVVWIANELRAREANWKAAFMAALRLLPLAALFGLLGFSIYLFLPIRSFKNPALDWSNPETPANLWRVITRADYGSFSLTLGEKLPRNLATMTQQADRYFSNLKEGLTLPGLLFGLWGWLFWLYKDRARAAAFLLLFLASGLGFLLLGNMPFDSQSTGILPRFYLMPAIPFALALGFGAEGLLNLRFKIAALAAGLLPLWLLFNPHGHRVFSRHDFAAYDYGMNLLRTLPKGAALYMDGGDDAFYTTAYLTLSEGLRPDAELHDRGGLIFPNPYGPDFRKISKPQKEERRRQVEGALLGLRPLFYSTFNRKALPGAELVQAGVLFEAVPSAQAAKAAIRSEAIEASYSYRGVYVPNDDLPYRLRALLPLYAHMRGVRTWDFALLRRALAFGRDILWLPANVSWEAAHKAFSLTQAGKLDEAEAFYRFLVEVDPRDASAHTNLGVLAERKGKVKEAEAWYQAAIKADPKYADAYYSMGVLYWKESRWPEVVAMFEKTLALQPGHPQAGNYLETARRRMKAP